MQGLGATGPLVRGQRRGSQRFDPLRGDRDHRRIFESADQPFGVGTAERQQLQEAAEGLKSRARVNSFSWARVKGAAEVYPINSTVLYCTPVQGVRPCAPD